MNEVKDEKAREAINQTVHALDEFNYDTCELVIKKKGFKNPETYIVQAFMIMAQQSINPKLYEKLLKIYEILCNNRKLHKFNL